MTEKFGQALKCSKLLKFCYQQQQQQQQQQHVLNITKKEGSVR